MKTSAKKEADSIKNGTEDYAASVFNKLELSLEDMLKNVKACQSVLAERRVNSRFSSNQMEPIPSNEEEEVEEEE